MIPYPQLILCCVPIVCSKKVLVKLFYLILLTFWDIGIIIPLLKVKTVFFVLIELLWIIKLYSSKVLHDWVFRGPVLEHQSL